MSHIAVDFALNICQSSAVLGTLLFWSQVRVGTRSTFVFTFLTSPLKKAGEQNLKKTGQ